MTDDLVLRAKGIPRRKKEAFLLSMSEHDFRDRVVRPLFLRRGLQDGRDTCGPDEKGKDTYFLSHTALGTTDVLVLQTKKGPLNLTRKVSQNLVEAVTQLKTALAARVTLSPSKERKLPAKAFLCTSGTINDAARTHIADEIRDPRVEFLDSDDLIPLLDESFPELWFDIEPELRPYLRELRRNVQDAEEEVLPSEQGKSSASAVRDDTFVTLRLRRTYFKLEKRSGRIERHPAVEELAVHKILDRRERLVLLTGEAGSGKSTTLRRLAYLLAQEGLAGANQLPQIPVLLKAAALASGSSLLELAAAETTRIAKAEHPVFSAEDLEQGRVTLFIDALDELSDDSSRTASLQLVEDFHKAYPSCQVLVTSRDYAFIKILPALGSFTRFHLIPISYKQAAQILKRVQTQRRLPEHASKEILRRLQDVHGLQLSPLLVTVFAATTDYSRRDIPANITELFKKYTEMMLGRWDAGKGLGQQYQAPLKDFILCQIAFEMHRREITTVSVDEFTRLVSTELQRRGHEAAIDEIVDEMLYRSGLFRIIGDAVEFRHHLLQEFFAGRGIPSTEFLESVISSEWWQRAIVFFFGQNPGDSRSLDILRGSVAPRPIDERFSAAITIGLALQACYLVEVRDKVEVLQWVITTLAEAKNTYIENSISNGVRPITAFIWYYIFGREAVACDLPLSVREDIRKALNVPALSADELETRLFWYVAKLIECGHVEEAEPFARKFHPEDPRLSLGVYLGCFLLERTKVATKSQTKIASQIRGYLEGQITPLRKLLLEEFKSHLLELHKGEIRALPEVSTAEHEEESEPTDES